MVRFKFAYYLWLGIMYTYYSKKKMLLIILRIIRYGLTMVALCFKMVRCTLIILRKKMLLFMYYNKNLLFSVW